MSPRHLIAVFTACVVLISAFLLVTASPALTFALPGLTTLPLGTVIAWAGAVALPLCIYAALNRLHPAQTGLDRGMTWVLCLLIVFAMAWAPVSYLLSGNLAFEFRADAGFRGSETALFYFFYFSMAVIVLPFVALAIYCLLTILFRPRARRTR